MNMLFTEEGNLVITRYIDKRACLISNHYSMQEFNKEVFLVPISSIHPAWCTDGCWVHFGHGCCGHKSIIMSCLAIQTTYVSNLFCFKLKMLNKQYKMFIIRSRMLFLTSQQPPLFTTIGTLS